MDCSTKDDNISNFEIIGLDNKTSEQGGPIHLKTSNLTQSKQLSDNEEVIFTGMQERTNKMLAIREESVQQQVSKDGEREAFVDWMRSVINELDLGLWRRCQRELTSTLYQFQSENDDLKIALSVATNATGASTLASSRKSLTHGKNHNR